MRKKYVFKKGQIFRDWTLITYLGGGGNGEVWTCENSKGERNAIKLLKKIRPKAYSRFVDETIVIEKNAAVMGIIPILEKHLPTKLGEEVPFYIMPLAVSIGEKINKKTLDEKIGAILQVAETLCELHQRKIYHRDIKPDNILFYKSRYCLADFGLVQYPDKKEVSIKNEEIGAKWTMAPEMKRASSSADASKADVYSLAKTLWIFLTERNMGFDGQYSIDSIIDLKRLYPESYTSPIDNLLISATDNDPVKRPSIKRFIDELREWQELTADFHKRNQKQWFEIQAKLFPTSIPSRVIWEDTTDIVKTLKVICSFDNLNHVFFPGSGGLDLEDVRLAGEEGCIELDFQSIDIVKPKRLLFESFGYNQEWNYFRLELDKLHPSVDFELENKIDRSDDYEDVSELSPGAYFPFEILKYRSKYERDYLITRFSRHVTRWFRGTFVIFSKRSIYNLISSTYDGRHNKMTTDEFRQYIEELVDVQREEEAKNLYFGDLLAEKRPLNQKEKVKHLIEENTVYRCGWCGDVVGHDGTILETDIRAYNIKVLEKFGHSVEVRVEGECCKQLLH